MTCLRRLVRKLLRRRRLHAELKAELAHHRELSKENCNPVGLGNMTAIRESTLDQWRFALLENAWRDLLLATRGLRRRPVYALTTISSLALGMGLCTAMFTILNAVSLRALPYSNPQQLVWVTQILKANNTDEVTFTPDFIDWRSDNHTFLSMAAYNQSTGSLAGIAEPLEVHTVKASAALLPLLGISPLFGRNLPATADYAGHEHAALLSHAIWQSRFASDTSVIGKPILLDGEQYTVVGILPKHFLFPGPSQVDIVTGLGKNEAAELARDGKVFTVVRNVIGRLKPGVTKEQARQDLTAIQAHLPRPPWNPTITIKLIPLRDHLFGNAKITSLALVAGALLFLFIASANVGSLSLVRLMQRDRELAIRRVLGAARTRVISQLLMESLLIASLASALGVLTAVVIRNLLVAFGPYRANMYGHLPIDLRVITFAATLLILTTLVFGMLPALRMSDFHLGEAIAAGQTSLSGKRHNLRLLSIIGGAEIAIVIALSSSAALMLKSFWTMRYQDLGFESQHVIAATINLGSSRYSAKDREFSFIHRLLERAAAIPGVEAVTPTIGSEIPPGEAQNTNNAHIEGRPLPTDSRHKAIHQAQDVDYEYFKILRIPLLKGRLLRASDVANSFPVVVVNNQFAQRYFPDESALGHRLETGEIENTWYTIVGVVGDAKTTGLTASTQPIVYTPYEQTDGGRLRDFGLMIRSALPLSAIAPEFRRIVSSLDPAQPVSTIETIDERLNSSVSRPRFTADILFTFACLGLLLAIIGVYGVVACRTRAQMREIALRQALGAQRAAIISNVLGHAIRFVLPGLVFGISMSAIGNRLISSLLFEVKPDDPATLLAVTVSIALAAVAAAFLPALHASRLDPLISLRQE